MWLLSFKRNNFFFYFGINVFFTGIFSLFSLVLFSQNNGINENTSFTQNNLFDSQNDSIHTNILPLTRGFNTLSNKDKDIFFLNSKKTGKNSFHFTPIVDLNSGISTKSSFIYKGQVGVKALWNNNNKWLVETNYAFISETPESYLHQLQDSLGILFGVGYLKSKNELLYGHYYTGKITYNPTEYFSFEIGRGKHFWGDGYRSLILSDNASPYPYLKINTKIWKIHYVNLWTKMRERNTDLDFDSKFIAMHALSWNISSRVNLSVYESVIWQSSDGINKRGLDINYFNPVIFYRPIEFSIGSADNEIIGLSVSYKYKNHTKFYSQIVLDEFLLKEIKDLNGWWANKFGIQVGVKSFNIFKSGIDFQSELNFARPFTYTHGSVLQNFGHERQSLAHPLETNFVEWVSLLKYSKEKWKFSNEFVWAIYGRDEFDQNLGGNLYESYNGIEREHGNYLAQGNKTSLLSNMTTFDFYLSKNKSTVIGLTNLCRYEARNSQNELNNYILLHVRINPIQRNLIR